MPINNAYPTHISSLRGPNGRRSLTIEFEASKVGPNLESNHGLWRDKNANGIPEKGEVFVRRPNNSEPYHEVSSVKIQELSGYLQEMHKNWTSKMRRFDNWSTYKSCEYFNGKNHIYMNPSDGVWVHDQGVFKHYQSSVPRPAFLTATVHPGSPDYAMLQSALYSCSSANSLPPVPPHRPRPSLPLPPYNRPMPPHFPRPRRRPMPPHFSRPRRPARPRPPSRGAGTTRPPHVARPPHVDRPRHVPRPPHIARPHRRRPPHVTRPTRPMPPHIRRPRS